MKWSIPLQAIGKIKVKSLRRLSVCLGNSLCESRKWNALPGCAWAFGSIFFLPPSNACSLTTRTTVIAATVMKAGWFTTSIFVFYVADLHAHVNMQCHQYADDTTLYVHCKPSNLESCKRDLNKNLCNLEEWSRNANLVINPSKTKMMVLSTKQLSSTRALEDLNMKIAVNNENIERVPSAKLLGTYINQHLKWEDNVKYICTSCYATLAMLRKVKNLLPFHIIGRTLPKHLFYRNYIIMTFFITLYRNI